jgi:hypothetical protein
LGGIFFAILCASEFIIIYESGEFNQKLFSTS